MKLPTAAYSLELLLPLKQCVDIFCKKMSLKLPDWVGNKKHTLLLPSLYRGPTMLSQEHVCFRGSGEARLHREWVRCPRRQFTKLLRSFMCTTDFSGVGVLEEPHDFVFHLYHYLSFNILPWVIHFLRGMNINVELLLAVFYQSYVFSHVFFLSLIMSTFIKYYSHSVHNFFWIHIF